MFGCGFRYLAAGGLMLLIARRAKEAMPAVAAMRNAALGGGLALAIGNGAVCLGEQRAPSGVVALVLAATPIFTVLINRALGHRARPLEWLGVFLGVLGVGLIQQHGGGLGDPLGFAIVLGGALAWAVASVILPRLAMPPPLTSTAIQMLGGGAISLLIGGGLGERLGAKPDTTVLLAMAYLVLAGSLLGYTAYLWLLRHTRPAVATSFFCVNPVVALALGAAWAGESLTPATLAGAAIVVVAVGLVLLGGRQPA
jgi:drug/metabolite transporter (DMT)-like permease